MLIEQVRRYQQEVHMGVSGVLEIAQQTYLDHRKWTLMMEVDLI